MNKTHGMMSITRLIALGFFVLLILSTLFPYWFTSYGPLNLDLRHKLAGPSAAHWLGTDEYGRDILCRIIYGARNSMLVGLGTALISLVIGVPLGLIAGYYGGMTDSVIMRIMDAFQSFPSMLLAILLMTVFEPSAESLIITISLVSFPRFTRLIRGSVLSMKKLEYVEAAKVSGANGWYVMFRSILPNCMSIIITQFSLLMSTAILIEASLSFVGFGIQPPEPAWGAMLSYAKKYVAQSFSYIASPTMTIFFVVMSINSLGDWLGESLDPKRKRR